MPSDWLSWEFWAKDSQSLHHLALIVSRGDSVFRLYHSDVRGQPIRFSQTTNGVSWHRRRQGWEGLPMAPFGSSFEKCVKFVLSFNADRRLTGRTKHDFEDFYEMEDPYGLSFKLKHMVRSEIILDFVRLGEFRRVLDIGCGEGQLTATLASFVEHIDAFDISEKAIERALRRGIKNVNFFTMDMRAVGNLRGTYDLIICSDSLYYTDMEERDQIVESVSRILSNDGVLLLSWLTGDSNSGDLSFEYGLQLLRKHFRVVTAAPNWVSFARKLPWLVIVRAAIVLIVSKLAPRWRLVLWKEFTLSTPIERALSMLYVAHKTLLRGTK